LPTTGQFELARRGDIDGSISASDFIALLSADDRSGLKARLDLGAAEVRLRRARLQTAASTDELKAR